MGSARTLYHDVHCINSLYASPSIECCMISIGKLGTGKNYSIIHSTKLHFIGITGPKDLCVELLRKEAALHEQQQGAEEYLPYGWSSHAYK